MESMERKGLRMKTLILAMLFAALMGYCLMPRVAPRVIEDIATPLPMATPATPYPVTPNWPRHTPSPATPATPKPWGTSLDQKGYNKTGGPGAARIIRPMGPKVN